MTTEERFKRIEENQLELQQNNIEIQRALRGLTALHEGTQKSLSELTAAVSRDIDGADARARRIEENLDGLIRAITAEHSNGSSKH